MEFLYIFITKWKLIDSKIESREKKLIYENINLPTLFMFTLSKQKMECAFGAHLYRSGVCMFQNTCTRTARMEN